MAAVNSYNIWQQADAAGFAAITSQGITGLNTGDFASLIKITWEKPFLKALDQDTFVFNLFGRRSTDDPKVRWKVNTTGNTGFEAYEEDDAYGAGVGALGAVADSTAQLYDDFEVNIKLARISVKYSNFTATMKGGAWLDIVADETQGALRDMRSSMNDMSLRILPGADARRWDSLGGIIGDGVSTDAAGTIGMAAYGGVTRTGGGHYGQSVVNTGSGVARALTLAQMQNTWALGQRPRRSANFDKILTSPALTDAYGDLADARRRWTADASGKVDKTDLAYGALLYKGVPVLAVQKFPDVSAGVSSRMYFLDTSVWKFYMGKSFDTLEVATTTDSKHIAFVSYGQLVCKAPWKQAVITDLSSTY